MPRSHSENENVQFVQELAEVDGPFESPININFRDLTKLELPSLEWNKNETCPKKMKITNTGHTVIINGKWKSERPYLCGGPLLGKYVFSQIHFHWGQDDSSGSEHHVCGEGFPLEMHVAHYKSDYLTQESALREKDGMVVLVYLFKLQEEPNDGLKRILSKLSSVKQANSSQPLDPRPILSLCNPFTDDYFMYWGSVVTPTCAHILLWIVCREPFGISKDQISEFRKICDSSHKPISRNSRDLQPLHKRNVFHVNASKNLSEPLLPIKKIVGCYCKGSGEKINTDSKTHNCSCQTHQQNQEDIEGKNVEFETGSHYQDVGVAQAMDCLPTQAEGFFPRQSIIVQNATVHSSLLLPKQADSTNMKKLCWNNDLKLLKLRDRSKVKLVPPALFFPKTDIKNRQEKRKTRDMDRPFYSLKAFSRIMTSLEALKNHTFKKLKEIESINQEIKEMKPFCKDLEEKRWLRRIEKIMSKQKQFTLKSSQGCLGELKKMAKECNVDKYFDGKIIRVDNNQKMLSFNVNETDEKAFVCSDELSNEAQEKSTVEKTSSKSLKFSAKTHKLIQSFFEDIKEGDDFQKTLGTDVEFKELRSLYGKSAEAGDSNSVVSLAKGCITQKMFTLGNLGDRFFAEVLNDDVEMEENIWKGEKEKSNAFIAEECQKKESSITEEETDKICKETAVYSVTSEKYVEEVIPLHKANVGIGFSKAIEKEAAPLETILKSKNTFLSDEEPQVSFLDIPSDTESTSCSQKLMSPCRATNRSRINYLKKSMETCLKNQREEFKSGKITKGLDLNKMLTKIHSRANLSTDSSETQRMIIAKFHRSQSRKNIRKRKPSLVTKISSKVLSDKARHKKQKFRNLNFEGYYIKKKKMKKNKRPTSQTTFTSFGESSSNSKDEIQEVMSKSKFERLTKTKFKLEIERNSDSSLCSETEFSLTNLEETKTKLQGIKANIFKAKNENKEIQKTAFAKESPRTLVTPKTSNESFPQQGRPCKFVDAEVGMTESDQVNDKSEIHRRQTTRIHILCTSANEFSAIQTVLPNTITFTASCTDLRTKNVENERIEKSENVESITIHNPLPIEPIMIEKKHSDENITNNSLIGLTTKPADNLNKKNKQIHTENINDREKIPRETSDLMKKIGNLETATTNDNTPAFSKVKDKKTEEKTESHRGNENKVLYETPMNKIQEYSVEFFTATSNPLCDDELLTKTQLQEEKSKNLLIKRCHLEKHHFLDKEFQETKNVSESVSVTEQAQSQDFLPKGDSNISFVKDRPTMKGDADVPNTEAKDLSPYVSYLSIRKNSQSKPHSAESLNPMKVVKRKRKKRPHCCKRNSRHYFRKNSSILKKVNQLESNLLHSLGLEEEEQLKIISANLAKYLQQKLVEHKRLTDTERKCALEEMEKVALKNLRDMEEKALEQVIKETEIKESDVEVLKVPEKTVKKRKAIKMEIPKPEETKAEKNMVDNLPEKKTLPKPVHNFIKLNKLNAGKYKRSSTAAEKKTDNQTKKKDDTKNEPQEPKNESPESKNETQDTKNESQETKNESREPKNESREPKNESREPKNESRESKNESQEPIKGSQEPKNETSIKQKEKSPVSNPVRQTRGLARMNSHIPKKATPNKTIPTRPASEGQEKRPVTPKPTDPTKPRARKGLIPLPVEKKETALKEIPSSSLALQKVIQPKERWVPAYMLTSYLPPPIEIVKNQQRKMNRYFLNMKKGNIGDYLPEILHETKIRPRKDPYSKSDLLKKDLEYLIKLQMCLNNEISNNIENSMNCVKTLLSQEYNGSTIIEKPPVNDALNFYDPCNKSVLLIKMNDILDHSGSTSDYVDDPRKCILYTDPPGGKYKSNLKSKEIENIKISRESGDSAIIKPSLLHELEGQEDCNPDSGYNCEISITLNAGSKEDEKEMQIYDPTKCTPEFFNNSRNNPREKSTSHFITKLDGSNAPQTITSKTYRKKRKDNEVSTEMKQKLLEILEGEIKREMEVSYDASMENSRDAFIFTGDNPEIVNTNQNGEIGCDNMELLAQISETMRQYLNVYKGKRISTERIKKPTGKDRKKGEDAS